MTFPVQNKGLYLEEPFAVRPRIQTIVHNLRFFDAALVAVAGAYLWEWHARPTFWETLLLMGLVPACAWLFKYHGLYESHRVEGMGQLSRSLLSAMIVGWGGGAVLSYAFGIPYRVLYITQVFLLSGGLLLSYRTVVYCGLRYARARGFDQRLVCVIGNGVQPEAMQRKFSGNAAWGYRLACTIEAPPDGRVTPEQVLPIHDLEMGQALEKSLVEFLKDRVVDEVLIWTPTDRVRDFGPILAICREQGLPSRILLSDSQFLLNEKITAAGSAIGGEIALQSGSTSRDSFGMAVKRFIDILVSAALLIALAPLLALVALLVKLSSPGPVLFMQPRMGRNGRVFNILKYRTMVDGADVLLPAVAARNITEGVAFKSRDDWRVTPVGRWMRRFSLDELPQLLNVLEGTMSLVGPRPLPLREAIQISGPYRRRFSVRPGITCLWQVNGRSDVTFGRWMLMDLEYVDSWSLWLDAKLLARTIPAVLSGRGSY